MESDSSHLRNLIERAREYDEAVTKGGISIEVVVNERYQMLKAAKEAETFLNREPEEKKER